jgi:predicted Rossmann-fold nucleotide-binding protein
MTLKKIHNLIRTKQEWNNLLSTTNDISDKVIQNLDFTKENIDWDGLETNKTIFLGCGFKKNDAVKLISNGAFVYPKFSGLPYNPHRIGLYTWQELMEANAENIHETSDLKIYNHFVNSKYNPPMEEAMAQRIHDYAIDVALRQIVEYDKLGMTKKKIVGFMGGHATPRGSEYYVKVALTAKRLTEKGYYVASGGGPGVMEAANLGGYFGNRPDLELLDGIKIMSDLKFQGDNLRDYFAVNYFEQAKKVIEKYPGGMENLAIPTWFYGHEPSNLFASHIAKYFSNSIREDTLLAICLYGIIYAPGSAGTTQEIFQEAAQNHYGTFGYYSPMVFMGKKRYVEDTSLYSVLHQLAAGMPYKELLYLTDDPEMAVNFIATHPPVKV